MEGAAGDAVGDAVCGAVGDATGDATGGVAGDAAGGSGTTGVLFGPDHKAPMKKTKVAMTAAIQIR